MLSSKGLTIQQLRSFVAVADEQQFTAAAEILNLAQPSISAQIRLLERALGTPLFQRSHRPVKLTYAGIELLPLARQVLRSVDNVVHGVSEVEALRRGHVTVGATPSLASTLLPSALARFHRNYPGVSTTIVERDSVDLLEELESAALDLALVIMPVPRPTLDSVVLAIEQLVVVVAQDHPLAKRTRISISDLDGVPMIMFREGYDLRSATFDAFTRAGISVTVALDGAEMGSVLSLVAANLGAAIVPSIVATDDRSVKVLHLRSPTLERTISLVRPLHHTPSRAAEALSKEITTFLSENRWPKSASLDLRLIHA
jgi:DNA-binding transcriptional LysR family regulator